MKHANKTVASNGQDKQPDFGIQPGTVASMREKLLESKLLVAGGKSPEPLAIEKNIMAETPAQETHRIKLSHLNRNRVQFLNHRPPTSKSRHKKKQDSPQIDFQKDSKASKTVKKNQTLEQDLKNALTAAGDKYRIYFQSGMNPRFTPGWLTTRRHGKAGQKRAEDFFLDLQKATSSQDMMDILQNFFTRPTTQYNHNSFAPRLLDELNDLLVSYSLPSNKPAEGQHYDGGNAWLAIRGHLETLLPPVSDSSIPRTSRGK